MMRMAFVSMLCVLFPSVVADAEDEAPPDRERILLWPGGAPGAQGDEEKDKPSITVYAPSAANGCAVVVCPGGGYAHLAIGHEGKDVGEWLGSFGVTAFVLRYRIAPYRHPAPMLDVQRAIRTVRSRAKEWRIDPQRIGVMGFSAGGHLASTAATHFDEGDAEAADPVNRTGCRPDFAILVYPVVSFTTEYAHKGSRRNLLGEDPDVKLVRSLSNELQVTKKTPPTFLMHTSGDTGVPAENSILFYLALRKAGVPAEMHVYEKGRHGFGLAPNDPALGTWPGRLKDWLKGRGLLEKE